MAGRRRIRWKRRAGHRAARRHASGIDDFETCRRLKADPRWRDIPVIFMTARDDVLDKLGGSNARVVDYITKPLQPDREAEVLFWMAEGNSLPRSR
jgi:CheY-like chemotaxis protein